MDIAKARTLAQDFLDKALKMYVKKIQTGRDVTFNEPVEYAMAIGGIETHVARLGEFDPDEAVPSQLCKDCG